MGGGNRKEPVFRALKASFGCFKTFLWVFLKTSWAYSLFALFDRNPNWFVIVQNSNSERTVSALSLTRPNDVNLWLSDDVTSTRDCDDVTACDDVIVLSPASPSAMSVRPLSSRGKDDLIAYKVTLYSKARVSGQLSSNSRAKVISKLHWVVFQTFISQKTWLLHESNCEEKTGRNRQKQTGFLLEFCSFAFQHFCLLLPLNKWMMQWRNN